MTDLEALRLAAEAANVSERAVKPVGWVPCWFSAEDMRDFGLKAKDCEFIALASPSTVLGLIERVEKAEAAMVGALGKDLIEAIRELAPASLLKDDLRVMTAHAQVQIRRAEAAEARATRAEATLDNMFAVSAVTQARAALTASEARATRAVELLRAWEWDGGYATCDECGYTTQRCIECGACQHHGGIHEPDCKLAALLGAKP